MTDLSASNMTYAFKPSDKVFLGGRLGYLARGKITITQPSNYTYPSGGFPVSKGKMGLPRVIKSLKVLETNALGFVFEYDVSEEKLRLFLANVTASAANPTGNVASNTVTVGAHTLAITNGGNAAANAAVWANANGLFSGDANMTVANAVSAHSAVIANTALSLSAGAITAVATKLAEAGAASYQPATCILEVEAIGY